MDQNESQTDEQRESFLSKFYIPEKSLAIYRPFKLVIPQEALLGVVIDGRYQVGEFLGGGFTGSVRSGKNTNFFAFRVSE